MSEDYAKSHNFVWFIGVVEDINDPLEMGRVRVRCFGFHTESTIQIPTKDLPWASVMTSITSAGMTGIGQSATGLLQGSWVIGFFRDGTSCQDPLIMGSLPSQQDAKNENSPTGFSDPSNVYPIKELLKQSDIARESKKNFKESYAYKSKESLRNIYQSISIANSQNTWSCSPVYIAPVYPHNHTTAFENNSNVVEYDSSSPSLRFSHVGPNKTFTEIDKEGTLTQVITGKRFQVIAKGDNVYIKGGCNLTIEDGCNTKITGDWNIQVEGNKIERVSGTVYEKAGGTHTIIAPKIDLNP